MEVVPCKIYYWKSAGAEIGNRGAWRDESESLRRTFLELAAWITVALLLKWD